MNFLKRCVYGWLHSPRQSNRSHFSSVQRQSDLLLRVTGRKQSHRVSTKSQDNSDCPVAIILGCYNSNAYLYEQIKSILDQSHCRLKIFISDDCSDSAVDIGKFDLAPSDAEKISLSVRPVNVGFVHNFFGALSSIDEPFQYFAFSDQDDVWCQDKISNALTILKQHSNDQPALYCARTLVTDDTCQVELGTSTLFNRAPSFANALMQSIGGGNTMVFNKAARDLIVKSVEGVDVVSHDWWCYQIITGAGGIVYYDRQPCLKYRQHANNLVGANTGYRAHFYRFLELLKGKLHTWNDINLTALSKNRACLTANNQRQLDDFIAARQAGLIKRLFLFKRSGAHRQTFLGNLGFFFAALFNKV